MQDERKFESIDINVENQNGKAQGDLMRGKLQEEMNNGWSDVLAPQESPLSKSRNEPGREEALRVAYVLNMCTVSVSQIIDYADVNVLEQEYDTILNNLNLEQMPKDKPFLKIFRQIMDTVTFFRLYEGDKKMIDREYQEKVKNAIWAAVPNFGLLLAGGNPITLAVSLASQVGIGYMNYRRNKNEYVLDRDKQYWQLQRSAIEQFHSLRRELFETAWRLFDTYQIEDKWRLTERQIKQYNEILMDQDELRRFERLESIMDKFEAYPAFWYQIGSTANSVYRNDTIDSEVRFAYRQKAYDYFEKYRKLNRFNILREDQIAVSCMLEYADLLDPQADADRINELLFEAKEKSGCAKDVLQLCTVGFLKIGNVEEASRLLLQLVNEDYNAIINAQMLSSIYAHSLLEDWNNAELKRKYYVLCSRVSPEYLFPMPKPAYANKESLEQKFVGQQKAILKENITYVLREFLNPYVIRFNKLIPFKGMENYPDSFFEKTREVREERSLRVKPLLENDRKKQQYLSELSNAELYEEIIDILNDLYKQLTTFMPGKNYFDDFVSDVKSEIRGSIAEPLEKIYVLIENTSEFSLSDFDRLQNYLALNVFVQRALDNFARKMTDEINALSDGAQIMRVNREIHSFCMANGIELPEVQTNGTYTGEDYIANVFEPELFGRRAIDERKARNVRKEIRGTISAFGESVIEDKKQARWITEEQLEQYLEGAKNVTSDESNHAIAVLDSKKTLLKDVDLLFTERKIVMLFMKKAVHRCDYDKVKLWSGDDQGLSIDGGHYAADGVDCVKLLELIKKCAEI